MIRKITFFATYLFFCYLLNAQTMVVKKADGKYKEISLTSSMEFSFYLPCNGTPTVNYSGRTYNTVQIGNQCWLKENLNVGTMVQVGEAQTNNGTVEKYCSNNDETNCTTYGGLYQWNEAMAYSATPGAKGICPDGWHIPTKSEFETLATSVVNGNALKAIGQGIESGIGTNVSGFSAIMSGYRSTLNFFQYVDYTAFFWSSNENGGSLSFYLTLPSQVSAIGTSTDINQNCGFSIRCIKD